MYTGLSVELAPVVHLLLLPRNYTALPGLPLRDLLKVILSFYLLLRVISQLDSSPSYCYTNLMSSNSPSHQWSSHEFGVPDSYDDFFRDIVNEPIVGILFPR